MAQYHARNQRDHSLPHRQLNREPPEDNRKNQRISSPVSSRLHENELLLRFDINMLLGLFNEMEVGGTGEVSWKGIRRILEAIGLQEHEDYLRV